MTDEKQIQPDRNLSRAGILDADAHPDTMGTVDSQRSFRTGILYAAFFWGSVWGFWEATAGYVVHTLRIPGLAGAIMIPAAVYFMVRAFAASGAYEAIFLAACAASSFKLLDLAIPGRDIVSVLNPAQFMLAESLLLIGVLAAFKIRSAPAGRVAVKGRAFGSPLARGLFRRASTAEVDPRAKPGALTRDINTWLSAAEADPQTKSGTPGAAPAAADDSLDLRPGRGTGRRNIT
jgi:hypothetical protein